MKLFIAKEKFASIKGFENFEDFFKTAQRTRAKDLTTAKIDENYGLIQKHSRFVQFHASNHVLSLNL